MAINLKQFEPGETLEAQELNDIVTVIKDLANKLDHFSIPYDEEGYPLPDNVFAVSDGSGKLVWKNISLANTIEF